MPRVEQVRSGDLIKIGSSYERVHGTRQDGDPVVIDRVGNHTDTYAVGTHVEVH